jgi:hypothetical protein
MLVTVSVSLPSATLTVQSALTVPIFIGRLTQHSNGLLQKLVSWQRRQRAEEWRAIGEKRQAAGDGFCLGMNLVAKYRHPAKKTPLKGELPRCGLTRPAVRRAPAVAIEQVERRMLLSSTSAAGVPPCPVVTAPIGILSKGIGAPDSYSSPTGAPISPALMRDAYGLGNFNASTVTFSGVQGTGAGQTIALVEGTSDPDISADLSAFDSYWGLPAPPSLNQYNAIGGGSLPSVFEPDLLEMDLDVEWAHVMAPQASLDIFEGLNLYQSISTAAATAGVSVVSISYSISGTEPLSEFGTPSGHNGVTFLASAGDTADQVSDPAMSPGVISVGGTDLYMNGTTYSHEAGWSSGGGGINTAEAQPAYQNGIVSAYSTTNRVTPDVALDADTATGVAVCDEYDDGTTDPWDLVVGGTSLSAPLMAGMVAVADQGRSLAGLGSLDGYTQTLPRLYGLYTADYADNYHDITTGGNGYAAGVGYDMSTGLGSPIGSALIPDLAGADTVTGKIFLDSSGNGVYGGSDKPLTGATVYLDINNTGTQTSGDPTAVTNSNGVYTFSDQIGSETGVVRLASSSMPSGDLHSTTNSSFTTGYDQTQTVNLGFYSAGYTAVGTASAGATSVRLSVSGTNPSDASSFIYNWTLISAPAGATPAFSANGTNAAANTPVALNEAGAYTFGLTVSDGQGCFVSSSVGVTIGAVLTSVAMTPGATTLLENQTQAFSAVALDQFGNALAIQPAFTWAIASGVGSLNTSNAVYSAPNAAGEACITATSGTVVGSATVTVAESVPVIINGTSDESIRLVRSGSNLLVFVNNPTTPAYNISYGSIGALTVDVGTGTNSVAVDFSGGASPVPAGGLTIQGGAGTDTLTVIGTTGNDTAAVNASSVTLNGSPISYTGVQSIIVDGNGGSDSLTQTASPGGGATLAFDATGSGGPSSSDTLNVVAGSYSFAAPAANAGIQPLSLAALNVAAGATVSVGTAPAHSDRWVLQLGSLALTGQLDLAGNDMILHNANLPALLELLQSGSASGGWNGQGIASTAAANDSTHLTAMGLIANNTSPGVALYGMFDNQSVSATDALVKFTYIGDANLDGVVDGSDYSRADNGFLARLTGWSNGDFDYDGRVDGSDYTLMDNTFNTQGASLASQLTSPQSPADAEPSAKSKSLDGSDPAAPTSNFSPRLITETAAGEGSCTLFWKWLDGAGAVVFP